MISILIYYWFPFILWRIDIFISLNLYRLRLIRSYLIDVSFFFIYIFFIYFLIAYILMNCNENVNKQKMKKKT